MAHPAPLSPLPPREVPEHRAGGSGGHAETLAGSPQAGEGLGGGGTRRSRAGARAGATPGSAGDAKCRRPGSGRSLVAAVPTRAFRGEAERAARGRGRVRFCTSGTGPALPGLLGQEAECVGRVCARAPCPVPLKRRASCSGRGRVRAGLIRTGPGGGLRPVGGGVCRAGERLAPTSAGAWRGNRTLQTAGGPRLSGALWVNFGPAEMGAWARGARSPPGSRPALSPGSGLRGCRGKV